MPTKKKKKKSSSSRKGAIEARQRDSQPENFLSAAAAGALTAAGGLAYNIGKDTLPALLRNADFFIIQLMSSEPQPGGKYRVEVKLSNVGAHSLYVEEVHLLTPGRIPCEVTSTMGGTGLKPDSRKMLPLLLRPGTDESIGVIFHDLSGKNQATATLKFTYNALGEKRLKSRPIAVRLRK